jgi:hypothetical protein
VNLKQTANWAEIIASVAVIASLVFLIFEVRGNTRALDRQAIRDQSTILNAPFVSDPKIPAILAKIKEIDGPEPGEQALIDRYGMSYEEAAIYGRYVSANFNGLEAEFALNGASPRLQERIQLLLSFPDVQIALKWAPQLSSEDFIEYVDELRDAPVSARVEKYRAELQRLREQAGISPK